MNSALRVSVTGFVLTLVPLLAGQGGTSGETFPELKPGNPLDRFVLGGTQTFRVSVRSGQFVRIRAQQLGVHLTVQLASPDGAYFLTADARNGSFGYQEASFVAQFSGEYRVQVSVGGAIGHYRLEIVELRKPKKNDLRRIEGQTAQFQAAREILAGTRESQMAAVRSYERAAVIWRRLKDPYQEALDLLGSGTVQEALGEKQQALACYERALALNRAAGDKSGEGTSLSHIGRVYYTSGDTKTALEYSTQALSLYESAGDLPGKAMSLSDLGIIAQSTGDAKQALVFFEQALPLFHAIPYGQMEAATRTNIGRAYRALGEKTKAMDNFVQALAQFRELKDRMQEAITLTDVGGLLATTGEKQRAEDYFELALGVFETLGDRADLADVLLSLGSVCRDLGEIPRSKDYFERVLPLVRELGKKSAEGQALNFLGLTYNDLGEKQKALEYYEQSISIFHSLGDRAGEATALDNTGMTYGSLGDRQKALEYYQRALPELRATGDPQAEGTVLSNIGTTYSQLGETQQSLRFLQQAIAILHGVGDGSGEARALNNLGFLYGSIGEKRKALEYFGQALPIVHRTGDRAAEATMLNNIGVMYDDLGEKAKALQYLEEAVPMLQAAGNRSMEATALGNIGKIYSERGEKRKAIQYLQQALPMLRETGNRPIEARTLMNMSLIYADLGEKQVALECIDRSLPLFREVGDRVGEGAALNAAGRLYAELSQRARALEYFERALPLLRATGARSEEATTMANIGMTFYASGELKVALDYLERALQSLVVVEDRTGQAAVLNNLGVVYTDLGESQKAMDTLERALTVRREVGDRAGEAITLNNLAMAYKARGEEQRALDWLQQALPVSRAAEDRAGEATVLGNLFEIYRDSGYPDTAIWFGKQAVNVLQAIRRDNQKLSQDLKRSYEKSTEGMYRVLAKLLVARQRFGEAEEILNLLKEKEASDFIRRDAVADRLRPATLLDAEKKILDHYEQILGDLITLGQQKASLMAKRDKEPLSAEETQEATRLDGELVAANHVLKRFWDEQNKALAAKPTTDRSGDLIEKSSGVQKVLRAMGPGVVAIYTVVTPDQYIAMLVTSEVKKAYITSIRQADLDKKTFEFRQLLQNPASDPVPMAQELYRIVFPESLRHDLDAMRADTIMWSMDGTLRYIPLAALHDGKQYLITRFRNSLITPASLPRLTEASPQVWRGIGFGVSDAKAEFNALPSVTEELQGIFRQKDSETAPIAGAIRLNGDFTKASFENALRSQRNSVVHIATHFDSKPGMASDSRLLLGDGNVMTLAEIEDQQDLFDGVELLTLSACSTAFTNSNEDGREVDSFGTIAQRLGAKGVIASLWNVSDAATSRLMASMYRIRQSKPELGKSEALRQAQEEMVTGALKPGVRNSEDRGVHRAGVKASANGWAHPYYWAPFILIGNWK
jgi:CHAT domain-containing protein/lipopolysaccharide biosynthesis regulator YciM